MDLAALPTHAPPERVMAAVEDVVTVEGGGLLLVLDNCEHVVDAAAMVAEQLSGATPGLRVLATSREPLGLAGEAQQPIPLLSLPVPGLRDPREMLASEAVRLVNEQHGGPPGGVVPQQVVGQFCPAPT